MGMYLNLLAFGFDDASGTEVYVMTTGVTDGNWHHVVGVYDGAELSLYVDGSLATSSSTFGATPATSTDDLSIGSYYGVGGTFGGEIDQLRMYDSALSSSQISDLFDEGEACAIGDNLAVGASVRASSTLNPLFAVENVVDGDTAEDEVIDYTMWLLNNGQTGWVELDFGEVIGIMEVRWANTHNRNRYDRATTDYRIEASPTGAFEADAVPIASGTGTMETDLRFHYAVPATPVAARYLRIFIDDYDDLGGGINEIEVYGLE
jgi:hypothetical protein